MNLHLIIPVLWGKITPPDLTQIHPTGFRFPPRSTTHRFTVKSRTRMTWDPSKGVQKVGGKMWLCLSQWFKAFTRFKDRHRIARTRQASVGRWIGITQSPKVFARCSHLERSRINRQINSRCYLLLTDSNLPTYLMNVSLLLFITTPQHRANDLTQYARAHPHPYVSVAGLHL